jgi:proteasome assembly chaperone (PAC2) family protein
MEIAALVRPTVRMDDGLVQDLERATNTFHADVDADLVFFLGKEPNLKWQAFSAAIFELIECAGVTRVIFMGSFGGTVPHTREPRMYGSVSHARLKRMLTSHGVKLSDYAGPTGFATWMLAESARRGVEMLSLVAEIPGYLQGVNPPSIEAVTRRLARIMNTPLATAKLREASNAWEVQVSEAVEKDEDLAATVKKLEEKYDNELIGVVTEDDDDDEVVGGDED